MAQEKDVEGTIKFIDDNQWYNGIIGQIPKMRFFLRENPLYQLVMMLLSGPPKLAVMAFKEVEKRKQTGGFYLSEDRKDLLGQLMEGNAKNPEKLSDFDVFSVAQGAM